MSEFAASVIAWQARSGRNDLPWQGTRDPYRIWLSEIMLQQTQVATVIPYYLRFLERFPDVRSLAEAAQDEVLALWSGLGYYSRGRNLHLAARKVMQAGLAAFPCDRAALESLPGVGRSTASAIAVFATGAREAILDGNVKRVLARHFGVEGDPADSRVSKRLWALAESLLPARNNERYTQGLMDLGATVCTRTKPLCGLCPLAAACVARREQRTHELPGRRPRKAVPHRNTVMLILRRGAQVLLEQRPPAGIWGGLWAMPQFDTVDSALEACRARYGCEVAGHRELAALEHGFTHYSLTIRPLLCESPAGGARAAEPGARWMERKHALESAIPAPVRTLLEAIAED
jgi:A/G-specific adenine glycosylase